MNSAKHIIAALLIGIGGFCIIGLTGVAASGSRSLGAIESIDGIAYPVIDGETMVLEKLAHADVYLTESVFAKQLTLSITFDPGNLTSLAVGVRENSFWLSYPKVALWNEGEAPGVQTRTVYIPITDAMQDANQSIDVMFFAQTDTSTTDVDEGVADTVAWKLLSLEARVDPVYPTLPEVKNFARSFLSRERPL